MPPMKKNKRKRDLYEEASTLDELKSVDRHHLFMFVVRCLFGTMIAAFSSVVIVFLYMTIKNNQTPSLDALAGVFSGLSNVLGIAVGTMR